MFFTRFLTLTSLGPVLGPLLAGFINQVGCRQRPGAIRLICGLEHDLEVDVPPNACMVLRHACWFMSCECCVFFYQASTHTSIVCARDLCTSYLEKESSTVRLDIIVFADLLNPLHRLRKSTGKDRYWAPLEREPKSVIRNIAVSSGKCFGMPTHLMHPRTAVLTRKQQSCTVKPWPFSWISGMGLNFLFFATSNPCTGWR